MHLVESPKHHTLPNLKESNISEANRAWLSSITKKQLPQVTEALAGFIDTNPRFHFTPTAFTFSPDSERSKDEFLKRSCRYRWSVLEIDSVFHVTTNHVESIQERGLTPKSCVATMPDGIDKELIKSHPRLFFRRYKKNRNTIWQTCHAS